MSESTGDCSGLQQLAAVHRVATEYWGQAGNHVAVSDDTVRAVLAALGVDASSEAAIESSLLEASLRDWRRTMPPVFVTWQGEERRLWVHVPHGEPVRAWIETDEGNAIDLIQWQWWVDPKEIDGVLTGEASFRVPADVPIGWHRIHVASPSRQGSCPLAVAPATLRPHDKIGERQWGLMLQAYSWPQTASWGVGDARGVGDLAEWSARDFGAGFVLVNPLHAPVAGVPSPYLPSSRRFVTPLMITPEDIPEFGALDTTAAARGHELRIKAGPDWAAGPHMRIDRERTWQALRSALEMIFQVDRSAEREQAFRAFATEASVRQFGTWCVLADLFGPDFRNWPPEFRDARSDSVRAFSDEHRQEVDFFVWLQWIAREQLDRLQQRCRDAGMAIGVMTDLAVGVHQGGADAWALASVLAPGVGVGAPPDMYNQQGQNWDQPPWRPEALADAAFVPFRDVVRAALRGAGGLRIDHILGLFRMWWIPRGNPATEGTYVGFDHDAMLAIVCLEAHRAGAVVIGEDLGTVEPWVQGELARRGLLGTAISWFEKNDDGTPVAVEAWRNGALGSVTVHDLPPTAGYLAGEHVRIRADLGLLDGPADAEWIAADTERGQWARLLRDRGNLAHDVNVETAEGRERMVVALHRALEESPCALIGVSVPDLLGDSRAQNQPGTDQEYPNWRMPIAGPDGQPVPLDRFLADPPALAEEILTAVQR